MTAPIQEPTESRTTSGLGYGQRQLFRRPSPVAGVGVVPWIRLKQIGDYQEFDPEDQRTVIWNDVCNPYPDIFDLYIESTEVWGINFLVAGLFQATTRIYPSPTYPPSGFELSFYSVDWDLAGYYSTYQHPDQQPTPPFNTSVQGYSEITFRAGTEDAFNDPWQLHVRVTTSTDGFTSSEPASYLEVRMLGTDPFFPLGLDNSEIECGS